ncbi:MAG: helicase-related protein [Thermodesulfobacteriota bacterium]
MENASKFLGRCSNWEQFVSYADGLATTKEKGDLFEKLVQSYLTVHPEYRTKLSSVWLLADVPRDVAKKLNLPANDEGIDLIAETHGGEFWAIQAKYRSDKETALNTRDLAKFAHLSFTHCKGITLGVVAHTTLKPVRKRKLLGKNVVEIGLSRWLELETEDWAAIRADCANKSHTPKARKPRKHQKEAVKNIRAHYLDEKNRRGRMIMPCASGKSLTAFWAAESLGAKTIILAVPSLMLIRQSVKDWTREYVAGGVTPDWLCVCSDETVGKVDSFVSSTYETGIPTTTKEEEIADFLKRKTSAPKVIFTTYQSSPRLAVAAKKSGRKIDLCILDEAHKTVGEKSSAFATLLDDRKLEISKRLFMTATERVLHGKNEEVLSMDDKRVYGGCFYQLTFKQAIDDGIICDYEILTLLIGDPQIRDIVKKNRFVKDRSRELKTQESASLAAGIALEKIFKKRRIKHAVSFHRSIRSAKDFELQQNELLKARVLKTGIENFHISSELSTGQRTEVMHDFEKSNRSLITNARCLTEGVDVPAIDCVLFADPKQSVVDIVQAAGRAMRPSAGKKKGYILLPIVVPNGVSFDEFARSTAFKKIASQITALSTQDERIKDYFRAVTEGRKHKGKLISISGDVPAGVNLSFNEFSKSIETEIWRKTAKVNWRGFEEAREYVRSLNLKSANEWRRYIKLNKLPSDIPLSPHHVYKNKGWISFGDWFGTGTVASYLVEFRPFGEARRYAQNLNLSGSTEWFKHTKSYNFPKDIPVKPHQTYKDKGWVGYGDWLGTGNIASNLIKFRTFEEARKYAQNLNLKSGTQWRRHSKSPDFPSDIPVNPEQTYKNKGWKGMGDWLGTGNIASRFRQYRTFEEARKYVRSLNLKSSTEWRKYVKSPDFPNDLPVAPEGVYKQKGWVGYGDWLGTGNIASFLKEYQPFEKARKYVRGLGLKNQDDWRRYAKSPEFPKDIPAAPYQTYKDKGWKGMGDWIGTGNIATQFRQYRTFEEAKEYARSLSLQSVAEWCRHKKKMHDFPDDVPATPKNVYKNKGWIDWYDFLGNERRKRRKS